MLSLNFASRRKLLELGLDDADVDAFIEVRTRVGEVLPDALSASGLSDDGRGILERAMEGDDETGRRMSRFELTLRPAPPLATMETMTVTVTHHGDIDRELRKLETPFLPHGPMQLRVFDVSHEHIVKIEVRSASGDLIFERAAIPLSGIDDDERERLEDSESWRHLPPLRDGESWSPDGEAIFGRLFVETHSRPGIEPVIPDPQFDVARKGRFIVPGQPEFRFDGYSFAFGFPGDALFSSLPTLFGDATRPHVARLDASDPLVRRIAEFVTLEPGEIDFDGIFGFEATDRPDLEAPGWAWVLTGPVVFVGFQPDNQLYEPHPEVIVTLPGDGLTSQSGVPYNVTERGLLDRPELFGADPGLNCRPFDQPGRILGERRFQTALRVTQPLVAEARGEPITFEDITLRKIDYPREKASETNPIEYEGDKPALYQAKSVAIGHVLETAVRYRSNGYSLGDIAYSLTLAPRQKRRIVKVDFSRTERARRQEFTRSEDEVADAMDSSRSYDNAVAASLDEWAKGRSQSSTTAAAAGAGFAMPGFVVGGGVATSTSKSSSAQSGGRRTAASETQQINDSIRRFGESLRTLQSTVVQEVEQEESVEGVSEVVQNINYTRSLSVIYYEILRHLRVDTEIAGVTECVYVPMPVREFTDARIKRHKDVLARYARTRWERLAFQNLAFLPDRLDDSDIPDGERADQELTTLSGSIYIKFGLEMPGEGEIAAEIDAATDETVTDERIVNIYRRAFGFFTPYLPVPISQIVSRTVKASPAERNRYFQREIAPHMARRYMNDLRIFDEDGTDLEADFTLATGYSYGRTIRVDFTVDLSQRSVTRRDLEKIRVMFDDRFRLFEEGADNPNRFLPPRSFMDVTRGVINYGNDHYDDRAWSDRGARDLVNNVNGHAEDDGALMSFKLDHADTRDLQELIKDGYNDFKARIAARPFFYHKAIWWRLDRDELYSLLDGYSFDEAGGRSLASIVERRPLGILGNALIFKVTTSVPLDPMFATFADLKNHYVAGLPPRDPIRISLPTDGLYARAHMDGCIAAEEHNGSFDWVFDNQEPELADLPASLLESRRSQPPDLTTTGFPETIINLQNAPGMPAPSGLEGALGAVQNAGAFRDMAGLAGTQANTRAGLQTAAGLATSFGGMAFQGAMAQLQADANAGGDLKGMFSAIEKARDNGLITPQQAEQAAMDAIGRRMSGKDTAEDKHRREIEKKAMEGDGGGSVSRTDKDGTETVSKGPSPTQSEKVSGTSPTRSERVSDENLLRYGLAGNGAMPLGGGFPIGANAPLDTRMVTRHPMFARPGRATIAEFFPNDQPVDGMVDEPERKRAKDRGLMFSAIAPWEYDPNRYGHRQVMADEERPDRVLEIDYLIWNFEVGGASFSDDVAYMEELRTLLLNRAEALDAQNLKMTLRIIGHADTTGVDTKDTTAEDRNRELARKRTDEVVRFLQAGGLTITEIRPNGGPFTDSKTEFKRASDRSVEIKERFEKLSRPSIERSPEQQEELIAVVDDALQEKALTGGSHSKVAAKFVQAYRNPLADLRIISEEKMLDYYKEVTRVLTTSTDASRPSIPITNYLVDGRALIDAKIAAAPSSAMAHDQEASAQWVIIEIENELASEVWKGINVHNRNQHRNAPLDPNDYWDRVNRWIIERQSDPTSIYNLASNQIDTELDSPQGGLQ